ncbi:MAG: DUF262 domain-containing protein [Chloroflexi bacterium]|nr:DUF262 domain-containing protein [Chloroflexota bacterium]
MDVTDKEKINVAKLIDAFIAGSLLRNPEYQRGEAWREHQKAAFVDSLFRAYPLPALFFFVIESAGLEDKPVKKFEIVDGQQRLIALRDFKIGKFALLEVGDHSKLKLPRSVRQMPAPWAGKLYSELTDDLKRRFDEFQIRVVMIGSSAHPDEVRDLFIRLQSGTALTRQQIRDAWPGNLGPFIESIAGKLDRKPSQKLFKLIGKWGQRADDEDRDDFVGDRQLAAQLLRVFLVRERDPAHYPSVSANELDSLYHEHTDWDPNGPTAIRFLRVLGLTEKVFEHLRAKLPSTKKFRRLDVMTVMMYLQDLTRSSAAKVERKFITAIADTFAAQPYHEKPVGGKSSSASMLKRFYEWWRERSPDSSLIRLDSRRMFSEEQKKEIWQRAGGKCEFPGCGETVDDQDFEYDHFPIPHRDGGPTEVSNGRLVHFSCHQRGRPLEEE